MKQLKYNVYDLKLKCWIEDSTGFDSWSMAPEGYIELWENVCSTDCDRMEEGLSGHLIDSTPDRFDILLWTGEKDRDGEDIYSGHFIQRHVHEAHCRDYKARYDGAVGLIRQIPFGFDVELVSDHNENAFSDPMGVTWGNSEIKIIGNKYDNPELMPGKEK